MEKKVNTKRLFAACCFAFISMSMVPEVITEYRWSRYFPEASFFQWFFYVRKWTFPFMLLFTGVLVHLIGFKRLTYVLVPCHIAGTLLSFFISGEQTYFFTHMLIYITSAMILGICIPLTFALYRESKTYSINYLYLCIPIGFIMGKLLVFWLEENGGSFWASMSLFLPTVIYGLLFLSSTFPNVDRITTKERWGKLLKSLVHPVFLLIFGSVALIGVFYDTGRESINFLLKSAETGVLIKTLFIALIMMCARLLTVTMLELFSVTALLIVASIFTAIGFFLCSLGWGSQLFIAAAVFAFGFSFLFPTLLGFVGEYFSKTGAVGLSILICAKTFGVYWFYSFINALEENEWTQFVPQIGTPETHHKIRMGDIGDSTVVKYATDFMQFMTVTTIALTIVFIALHIYHKRNYKNLTTH